MRKLLIAAFLVALSVFLVDRYFVGFGFGGGFGVTMPFSGDRVSVTFQVGTNRQKVQRRALPLPGIERLPTSRDS